MYVVFVSGGTAQIPSDRKYRFAAPFAGAGTKPAFPAADDVAPVMLEYVVFVGVCQVPSPRRNLPCAPAAGAGTKPAFPAALAVAAVILLYFVSVNTLVVQLLQVPLVQYLTYS